MSVGSKSHVGRTDGPQAARMQSPVKSIAETPTQPAERPAIEMMSIAVPVSDLASQGYQTDQRSVRHLEVQLRDTEQAKAFMRMRSGLYASSAKLKSGVPVASNADCLRWLIEQVEESRG